MAVTSLENTKWKFNNTVSNPTKRLYVYSSTKSETTLHAHFFYMTGTTRKDVYCYPIETSSYNSGYYSIQFFASEGVDVGNPEQTSSINNDWLAGCEIEFFSGFMITDGLIAWLEANATQIIETPTTITCNGVDTELNEGQTATLHCANKKAESDIVVVFGSAGTITYNGTETSIEGGKIATLHCNGKKMKTDVVIGVG